MKGHVRHLVYNFIPVLSVYTQATLRHLVSEVMVLGMYTTPFRSLIISSKLSLQSKSSSWLPDKHHGPQTPVLTSNVLKGFYLQILLHFVRILGKYPTSDTKCRRMACMYTDRTGIKLQSTLLWHSNTCTIWLNGSRGPTRLVAFTRSMGPIT